MKNGTVTRNIQTTKHLNIKKLTMTSMLSAIATILMFLNFSVPLMPSFIKIDLSELPALIASFSIGPISGILVCFIKNLINLTQTTTSGIGELSNFILGCTFVIPAGVIYNKFKTKKGALIGSLIGTLFMSIFSVFSNYFFVYPIYSNFIPIETILNMYQTIYSKADTLLKALLIFNMPFTFIKGMLNVAIAFLIYKPLSPIIKNNI